MPQWLLDLFARYGYAVVFGGVFLERHRPSGSGRDDAPGWSGARAQRPAVVRLGSSSSRSWPRHSATTSASSSGAAAGVMERHGWRIGLTRERLAEFDCFFHRHGPKTVFAARFITGLRCCVLAGGSTTRWPASSSTTPRGRWSGALAVASAGYSLAYSWATLKRAGIRAHGARRSPRSAFIGIIGFVRARRNRHPFTLASGLSYLDLVRRRAGCYCGGAAAGA